MRVMEKWKYIEDYEGLYEVSNLGRVRSLYTGKILKPRTQGSGYLQVDLYKDGKKKNYFIHRLVALAFIPNDDPEHKTEVNHINDEDKTDNRACNLNWMDHKQNVNWGTRNERSSQNRINHPDMSKTIRQMTLDGQVVAIWPSIMEASRNGFSQGNISNCCNGKIKTAYGYKWEYV